MTRLRDPLKARLAFMIGDSGDVGLEAPLSLSTLDEIQHAFTALLNCALQRGYIADVPPTNDPMLGFRVTIERPGAS